MNKKLIIIIFFVLSINVIWGKGFNVGTGINSYFSNNIFLNSTSVKDLVTILSADLNLTGKNVNLYFEGDFSLFKDNSDFNSFRLTPGVQFLKYLKGRNYLYFDLSYPLLEYRDYYTDFNYSGPRSEAGLKYYLASTLLLKSGYSFELRNYSNFSSFDFINHTVFFEINKFFPSQTTLRLQTGINYRYYRHIARIIPEEDWNIDTDINAVNSMSVPNLSGILRVSQGIGSKVGIYGEAEYRKNFRGLEEAETLINNSYVIYPYNDNYLWEGTRLTLNIKFIPFSEISVSGRLSFLSKNYPGIFIMDEEGLVVEPREEREDSTTQFDISVSKKFPKASLFLNMTFRDNRSLDSFFDYRMLTLSASIRYYF